MTQQFGTDVPGSDQPIPDELLYAVIEDCANLSTVRACDLHGLSIRTFHHRISNDETLHAAYQRAKERRKYLYEDVLHESATTGDVEANTGDTKWMLARIAPDEYGSKAAGDAPAAEITVNLPDPPAWEFTPEQLEEMAKVKRDIQDQMDSGTADA